MKKIALYTLFLANLFIILFFWWNTSGPLLTTNVGNFLLALGRIIGLLAVYAILIQFTFMGRVRWLEEVFGLDNLATLHHWNGYLSISLVLLHPSLIITAYAIDDKVGIISQFLDFLFHYDDILKAVLAVCLFCVVVVFSIYIVRKKLKYEYWYFIHLSTYIAVLFAWGHQLPLGGDFGNSKLFTDYWYALYAFVFANFFFYRFVRQSYLFYKHRFVIEKVVPETENVSSIYITGKNIKKFKFKPGQFINLRFLNQYWWQQHPFSLSSLPQQNTLRISVKHAGDFTGKVHAFKEGTPILLDGPFGAFTQKKNHRNKILFIAGGIGITPIRILLEKMASEGKDIVLIYSNRTAKDIVFKKELDELSKTYNFPIHYVFTQNLNKATNTRINAKKIHTLVADITQREIFICGPARMMTTLEKEMQSLGVKKSQIHYEKFSLQ